MKSQLKNVFIVLLSFAFQGISFSQSFQDNFNDETLGETPTNWQIVRGEGVVANVDNRNVVDLSNNSIIKPIVNGQTQDYLNDQFVLEFDAYFDAVTSLFWQRYELRFWEGVTSYNNGNLSMQAIQVHSHGAKTTLTAPEYMTPKKYIESLETLEPVWRHIKVDYNQGAFKLYIDEELILDFPQLPFKPKMISIGAIKYEPKVALKGGITNVKISEIEQTNSDDSLCGALPTEEQLRVLIDPNSMFNKRLKFLENYTIEDLRGVPSVPYINGQFVMPQQVRFSTTATENYTVIPIVAHILRRSDQKDGLALDKLYKDINDGNELFDAYGVFLHLEKVLYIDNDVMYNTTFIYGDKDDEEVEVLNITSRNVPRKLNIYYVPNTKGTNGKRYSWSSFPSESIRDQHIIMNNEHGGGILVHEIGHWFNLLHTHETKKGVEAINGSNCATTGDLCCDTPADPNLSDNVDETNCNYTGTDIDNSGESYNPDTTNIMSYTKSECRDNFSNEQVKRMQNSYLGMEDDRGYTFHVNKYIGQNIQSASFSSGWRAAEHFEIGIKAYMVCFNDSTSEIAIHELSKNGKLGSQVDYKKFRGKMSFVNVFKKGTARYLTLINYDLGELGIVKLNSNGTIGGGQSYHIGTEWVNSYIYSFANKNLLVLISKNGEVATYQIDSNVRLGALIHKTPPYYKNRILEKFGSHIIAYNKNDGYARKAFISSSGIYSEVSGSPKNFGKNWVTIKYVNQSTNYGSFINNILLLDKSTGQIKQYQWEDNNSIGENWYDSAKIKANLATGFDAVTPYVVFDGNKYQGYVMISNSSSGKILTYHLN